MDRNMPGRNKYAAGSMLVILSIVLAFGCTKVGPDFSSIPAAISSEWLAVDNQRAQATTVESRDWWQAFADPLLDQLIETA
jgi:outer membrane protein, multidrug efflux system